MRMQASLLASAALTAEVDTLKQNLERSEQEFGRAKKQLEDNEGKKYLVFKYIYKKVQLQRSLHMHIDSFLLDSCEFYLILYSAFLPERPTEHQGLLSMR